MHFVSTILKMCTVILY